MIEPLFCFKLLYAIFVLFIYNFVIIIIVQGTCTSGGMYTTEFMEYYFFSSLGRVLASQVEGHGLSPH